MDQQLPPSDHLFPIEDKEALAHNPLQDYASNQVVLHEFFIGDVFAAYDRYNDHHRWELLADELWEAFSYYIGFRSRTEGLSTDEALIQKQVSLNAKQSFLSAFEGSFSEFYTMPKQHAIQALTRLAERLRADKDFEALTMTLTEEMGKKVDFFINRIDGDIRNQESRGKNDLLQKTASDGESTTVIKNFQEFCLEKIKQMPVEERKRFLSITTGDRSFYDVGINWKEEYNRISGKSPIRDHKTPLSNAKRQYKGEEKN